MEIPYDSPNLDSTLDALANANRRGIIHSLSLHPDTVGHLARDHKLSLPAIHKHIRILEDAKLIVRRKTGRTNFVALDANTLGTLKTWIMQYHTEWGSVDATLENYIAKLKE